jgi:Flp pilus assembly protein TadG
MFGMKGNKFRALNRGDAGGALVETALCMSIFILALFTALDFGYFYYVKATLQNAVRQGARYAVTGNCVSGSCFSGTNQSNRLDSIVNTVIYYSFNLGGSTATGSNPLISVTCTGTCASTYGSGSNNAGGPGDTVTVSATYTFYPVIAWQWFQSTGGTHTFTVSSSFINEQFPPASGSGT